MLSGAIHFTGRKVCGEGERTLTCRLHSDVCRSTNGKGSSLGCGEFVKDLEECIKDLACIVSPMCLLFTATRYVVCVCIYMFTCMQVLVVCMCVCVCVPACVCACLCMRACLSVHAEAKDLHCCSQETIHLCFFLFCPSLRKISHWPGIPGISVRLPSIGIPHTNHYVWLFT